jgi:hypothetical protein
MEKVNTKSVVNKILLGKKCVFCNQEAVGKLKIKTQKRHVHWVDVCKDCN